MKSSSLSGRWSISSRSSTIAFVVFPTLIGLNFFVQKFSFFCIFFFQNFLTYINFGSDVRDGSCTINSSVENIFFKTSFVSFSSSSISFFVHCFFCILTTGGRCWRSDGLNPPNRDPLFRPRFSTSEASKIPSDFIKFLKIKISINSRTFYIKITFPLAFLCRLFLLFSVFPFRVLSV